VRAPARIAVGYDGSPGSEAALRWAAGLAGALGTELKVIHAVGLLEHAGLAQPSVREERAREIAAAAGMDPSRVEWCVHEGEPGSVLCRVAEGTDPVELLVVGTRRARVHPGLLGSTSLSLVAWAPVPVVVVPPVARGQSDVSPSAPALGGRRGPGNMHGQRSAR
jgi:nucleotide-binding universal stress UspA family protein